MTLSKKVEPKPVDGGKFCADCGGKCCNDCAEATAYFYQSKHAADLQRFTPEELEVIAEIQNDGRRYGAVSKDHPIYKLADLFGVPFNSKTGFNGPTGCRLPREKRSRTCLRYFCTELAKHVGIDPNTWWGDTTKAEIDADRTIFGKEHSWCDNPVTKYIELIKQKKAA